VPQTAASLGIPVSVLTQYVVVESAPEGTHFICCETVSEVIVMFKKCYNCLNFAGPQESSLAVALAAGNGDP
jgi:hypothetical protein